MERRNFIRNMTIGGAATMFAPSLLAMSNSPAGVWKPGKGIAPFLIFEDCVKSVLGSPLISNEFKEAITGDIHRPIAGNLARLASSLPNGQEQILEMINKLKTSGAKTGIKFYNEKLSFVLGWVLFKAATKGINSYNLKLFRLNHPMNEVIAYQDSLLLKERLGIAGTKTPSKDESASLLLGILARAVTRIHTLTPDRSDGREWIIKTADWRINNKTSMEMIGAIMENPDPQKKNLFWDKASFYNPADPLIQNNFSYGFLNTKNKSLYANGIINGYKAILEVQNYMEDKASSEAFTKLI